MVQAVFWVSIGLIVYSYAIYPLFLFAMVRLQRKTESIVASPSAQELPKVSLIIAAYCEEDVILQRVHNALMLDYPADRIEVLIGVDGNLDATGELVESVKDDRIRLHQFPIRRGKASVLNDCAKMATGEILMFSDANTFWDADAAKRLAAPFVDDSVGGVVGRLILTDAVTGKNCDGLYWKYENLLKEWEGQIGALLGANGAIYALRKSLWNPIPGHTIVDDFLIGMRVHRQRKKLLYDKQAIAREETAPTIHDEFRRRARIGAGGFQSLFWMSKLLSPTYGKVSWAFWSHKVLRWFGPLLMITAFGTNLVLADQPLYLNLLIAQGLFYAIALCGALLPFPGVAGKLVRVFWMFVNMNAALAVGFFRWLSQAQSGTWSRTNRSASELRVDPPEAVVK